MAELRAGLTGVLSTLNLNPWSWTENKKALWRKQVDMPDVLWPSGTEPRGLILRKDSSGQISTLPGVTRNGPTEGGSCAFRSGVLEEAWFFLCFWAGARVWCCERMLQECWEKGMARP